MSRVTSSSACRTADPARLLKSPLPSASHGGVIGAATSGRTEAATRLVPVPWELPVMMAPFRPVRLMAFRPARSPAGG
jgi:hypothetical protein